MEKKNWGCGPNRNWATRGIDGDSAGSVNEKAGPFLLSDGASRIAHALLRQTLEFIPLHLTNKTIETTLLYEYLLEPTGSAFSSLTSYCMSTSTISADR